MRERYGVDAPKVMLAFGAGSTAVTALAWPATLLVRAWWGAPTGTVVGWLLGLYAAACWLLLAWSLYGSVRGKRREWAALLDELAPAPDARILELGPGRGAILVEAARRVPCGTAVGVDLWRGQDQSGNSASRLLANAAAAGVSARVTVVTGDMRHLPFADATFDLVLASLALHNIPAADQPLAIREALRVLTHTGRIAILDYRDTPQLAALLTRSGATDITRSGPRWRLYPPARTVTATAARTR